MDKHRKGIYNGRNYEKLQELEVGFELDLSLGLRLQLGLGFKKSVCA